MLSLPNPGAGALHRLRLRVLKSPTPPSFPYVSEPPTPGEDVRPLLQKTVVGKGGRATTRGCGRMTHRHRYVWPPCIVGSGSVVHPVRGSRSLTSVRLMALNGDAAGGRAQWIENDRGYGFG